MRQGIVLLAALFFGSASAQQVYKCVGKGGAVSFQSAPCDASQKSVKSWEARPEPPPTAEELRQRHRQQRQGEAESRYLSRLAGTDRRSGGNASGHFIGTEGAGTRTACERAKRERQAVLDRVGLKRTYDLLQRLDAQVHQACK